MALSVTDWYRGGKYTSPWESPEAGGAQGSDELDPSFGGGPDIWAADGAQEPAIGSDNHASLAPPGRNAKRSRFQDRKRLRPSPKVDRRPPNDRKRLRPFHGGGKSAATWEPPQGSSPTDGVQKRTTSSDGRFPLAPGRSAKRSRSQDRKRLRPSPKAGRRLPTSPEHLAEPETQTAAAPGEDEDGTEPIAAAAAAPTTIEEINYYKRWSRDSLNRATKLHPEMAQLPPQSRTDKGGPSLGQFPTEIKPRRHAPDPTPMVLPELPLPPPPPPPPPRQRPEDAEHIVELKLAVTEKDAEIRRLWDKGADRDEELEAERKENTELTRQLAEATAEVARLHEASAAAERAAQRRPSPERVSSSDDDEHEAPAAGESRSQNGLNTTSTGSGRRSGSGSGSGVASLTTLERGHREAMGEVEAFAAALARRFRAAEEDAARDREAFLRLQQEMDVVKEQQQKRDEDLMQRLREAEEEAAKERKAALKLQQELEDVKQQQQQQQLDSRPQELTNDRQGLVRSQQSGGSTSGVFGQSNASRSLAVVDGSPTDDVLSFKRASDLLWEFLAQCTKTARLVLSLPRGNVVDTVFQKVPAWTKEKIVQGIKVSFVLPENGRKREEGQDGGGLSTEFFGLFWEELPSTVVNLAPKASKTVDPYKLFQCCPEGVCFLPSVLGESAAALQKQPDLLPVVRNAFECVGKMLFKTITYYVYADAQEGALMRLVPLQFTLGTLIDFLLDREPLYEGLGGRTAIEDVVSDIEDFHGPKHFAVNVWRNSNYSLEGLHFGYATGEDKGKPVERHQVELFVRTFAQFDMVEKRRQQLQCIKNGFTTFDISNHLRNFSRKDLLRFIRGDNYFSAADLWQCMHFDYNKVNGFPDGRGAIEAQVLEALTTLMDDAERRSFLHWATGYRALPMQQLVLTIELHPASDALPKAHTCTPSVDLPIGRKLRPYTSAAELKKRLMTSVNEGGTAFTLK